MGGIDFGIGQCPFRIAMDEGMGWALQLLLS
jgi:hypothetical protein